MRVLEQFCGGLTKKNQPCNIYWGLDAFGYCKFHTPDCKQCRGIARSTGLRCRIKWDLDCNGYCGYHGGQASQQSVTTRRNRTLWDVNSYDRASYPPARAAIAPVCQGYYNDSGDRCVYRPKPGYGYCCASHNPSEVHVSPRLFDSENHTRALLEDQVVEQYKCKDAYHFDTLDLVTRGMIEMDHVLEKQCFSYALRNTTFRDGNGEMYHVAGIVRDKVVNELPNLCMTRAKTNKIKGAAVWKFLDDSITGHVGYRGYPASFTGYMMAETQDTVRLGRKTTNVITKAMGSSLKRCQRQLADEGDTPSLDAVAAELQKLYVMMQLQHRERR